METRSTPRAWKGYFREKATQAFDALRKDRGVEPILLPPRSPNVSAHCERFVRSIREETLDRLLMLGERSLHYVIHQYGPVIT